MAYDLEPYWSRVAGEIRRRGDGNLVAGDDDPYFRYKRAKFLRRFLATLDVAGKRVLELGCGPGGNLRELAARGPAALIGVDISASMLALAERTLAGHPVELKKTDGSHLPLADRSVDLAFTVTVLQHNVEHTGFARVVGELCRVALGRIVIMEDVGDMTAAPEGSSWIGRPVAAYRAEFERHGFRFESASPLNLRQSRRAHDLICRGFVPASHREGEPLGGAVKAMLTVAMTVTRRLDDFRPDRGDLTRMVFARA